MRQVETPGNSPILSRDKFILSHDMTFMSHRGYIIPITTKHMHVDATKCVYLLPITTATFFTVLWYCIRLVHYKTLIPCIPMFCYILNIKMTSLSLSNFTELRLWLIALHKNLKMVMTSFLCSDVIEHRYSWNKC